ncbi:hypothetical protein GOBAR_AA23645 [Gossypium barbadense]|uniref:Uncharacterized protein n=1 Tax=Gossypium barbadense TaxID=3634 RepID=A0A2P5X119_GOSBA|nr:hypothetical protein GOBAR_AA23645 [Gossypium barbadense]
MLTLGQTPLIPVVSKVPTIILGMGALFGFPEQSDVPSIVVIVPTIILGMGALFGFPEQSDVPSIVVIVSSRQWPLISSYGASGRT